MPTHEQMTRAVHAYVDAFEREDPDAIAKLFAEAATVEDPVGAPAHAGMGAIRTFYTQATATVAKLILAGPIRTTANCAAFAFSVALSLEGEKRLIDVIDTFTFDEQGKITQMRAFWGPDNVRGA